MSQDMISDPAGSPPIMAPRIERSFRKPLRLFENVQSGRSQSPNTPDHTALPAIEPGQLWLIEVPTQDADPAPFERRALTTANVVIYDRALGATVAAIVPLGSYAEAAPSDREWALERSLRFARDGWSVVRLVDGGLSRSHRIGRIRCLSEQLIAANIPIELPVSLFVSAGDGSWKRTEACLGTIPDACDLDRCLTVVFGTLGLGAPRLHAASSNGLAG